MPSKLLGQLLILSFDIYSRRPCSSCRALSIIPHQLPPIARTPFSKYIPTSKAVRPEKSAELSPPIESKKLLHPKPCPTQSTLALPYLLSSHSAIRILLHLINCDLVKASNDIICHPALVAPDLHKAERCPTHSTALGVIVQSGPSADPSECASELSLIHRNESSSSFTPHHTHRRPRPQIPVAPPPKGNNIIPLPIAFAVVRSCS